MSVRLAFVGFRHSHATGLYRDAQATEGIEIVAACEEDAATRTEVARQGLIRITHERFEAMLATVECDAIAVGDCFAKRGSLIIRALAAGKHVISDKPICTRVQELDEIEVASTARGLRVGCQLTLRDSAPFIGLRNLVRGGLIGEVHGISFLGNHALLVGSRPAWYFEPGQQGGTINDIAVHAMDLIPWVTGLRFARVEAARCWNAFAREFPDFEDAGQMMLTMGNGCGVLGDVSYFAPDSQGYALPSYWRFTVWGQGGMIETWATAKGIAVALNGECAVRTEPLPADRPRGYLESFRQDIWGELGAGELDTRQVLAASRLALQVQEAADSRARGVAL